METSHFSVIYGGVYIYIYNSGVGVMLIMHLMYGMVEITIGKPPFVSVLRRNSFLFADTVMSFRLWYLFSGGFRHSI